MYYPLLSCAFLLLRWVQSLLLRRMLPTLIKQALHQDGSMVLVSHIKELLGLLKVIFWGTLILRPEYTVTNEIGTELKFFDNKLSADITLYQSESRDIIVAVPVAGSSGFTNTFLNAGTMTNTGVEAMLNATLVESNDFKWNAGMTFTRNRNIVQELAEGVDVISLPWGFFGANQRLVAGEAYGTLYGDDWARDEAGNALVDASGYPVYSSTEVVVGDPNPDWLMGITSLATYKNWSFNMLWDIRSGGDIWNGTRGALYYFGTHADTDVMPDGTKAW